MRITSKLFAHHLADVSHAIAKHTLDIAIQNALAFQEQVNLGDTF